MEDELVDTTFLQLPKMKHEEGTYGRTLKLLIKINNCANGYNKTTILTKQDCIILQSYLNNS